MSESDAVRATPDVPVQPLEDNSAILNALATDPDVRKLCAAHPELTEERVRSSLQEAAKWAAYSHVEPGWSEKLLNACILPLIMAMVVLSYFYMVPLACTRQVDFLEMDLGAIPGISESFIEYHRQPGCMLLAAAVFLLSTLAYVFWACGRRWRLVLFRRVIGLVGGLYAAWVVLSVLLPIIVLSARLSR